MRAALLALALLPGLAAAQEAPRRAGLEVNLGAGPLLYPSYPGAGTLRAVPFPSITGGYADWLELDTWDGARVNALAAGGVTAGPLARLRFGRATADSRSVLTGLRSFPDTLELGGFVAWERGPFYADAALSQDVARAHGGAALELRALLSVPLGQLGLEFGPEARVVDRSFAQSFFGVPAAAATAARPAYAAPGGVERIGAIASAEHRIGERLSVQGFVEYARLQGLAAESPIVRAGSADQWHAGLFLVWRLW